jgi:DNA-binding response OmpR family regulator
VALDVLAVLSDSEALSLLGGVLAEHGDRLTLARDLDDALARISSEAPDAALVDVSLGDANGKGVAIVEQACALSPRTAVFAVAPEERADLVSKIGAIDCAGLLPLPFRSEALRAALLGLRGEPAPRRRHSARLRSGSRRGWLPPSLPAACSFISARAKTRDSCCGPPRSDLSIRPRPSASSSTCSTMPIVRA